MCMHVTTPTLRMHAVHAPKHARHEHVRVHGHMYLVVQKGISLREQLQPRAVQRRACEAINDERK